MNEKDAKLEKIVNDFSRYIAIKISEYSLSRYGIFQEDIFQDIYVKLWKSIDNGRNINHLPAYIRKTINSVVINQILSNKKTEKSLDAMKQQFDNNPYNNANIQDINGCYLSKILFECINKLKDSKKRVIKLYLMGHKINEISKLQGWSLGKTNNLYYRAIKDLRKLLKEKGIFHES